MIFSEKDMSLSAKDLSGTLYGPWHLQRAAATWNDGLFFNGDKCVSMAKGRYHFSGFILRNFDVKETGQGS
jgi:hypothetical protein